MATRWGVLSTARIALTKVIPAIQRARGCRVVAIASRDADKAAAAARELGIPKAYGSYEELLADPQVDVVYNPLPNNLHVPMTLEAVAAGKHVLCEKPIGLDATDAARLLTLPQDRLVMEAFMMRFHPQWIEARDMVRRGVLGELRLMQAIFSYFNDDPANIRNRSELGGGGLLDVGCYPVAAARFLFEAEPVRVMALIEHDRTNGTDWIATAILDFGSGRRAEFTVGTQLARHQRVQILGTAKRLELTVPFGAPQNQAVRLLLDDGTMPADARARISMTAEVDQYALQAEAFAAAVQGETKLPYGPEDAVANMKVLDALARSGKSGAWEQP